MSLTHRIDPDGPLTAQVRSGLLLATLAAHLAAIGAAWTTPEPAASPSEPALQVTWVMPSRAAPDMTAPARPDAPARATAEPPPVPTPRPVPVPVPVPVTAPTVKAVAPVAEAITDPAEPATPPATATAPATMSAASAVPAPSATSVPSASSTTSALPTPPQAVSRLTLTATDWVRPPVYTYPREALRRREQGVVAVRIRFDTQGIARELSLLRSSGSAALDAEALARLREARARPRLRDGVPVEFLADTEAEFTF